MPRGKLSRHKKFKLGCEPGDIYKREKIMMLEKGFRVLDSGEILVVGDYKKDHVRGANRNTRHYTGFYDEVWE